MKPSRLKKASVGLRSPGFFVVAVSAMAVCSAVAQPALVVHALSVQGNIVFSERQILEAFRTAPGKPLEAPALSRDLEDLKNRYHSSGYLSCTVSAQIDSVDAVNRDIRIVLREGKPVVVGSVDVVDSIPGMSRILLERLDPRRGSILDRSALEDGIHRILKALEQGGHPLASVSVSSMSIDTAAAVDSAHIVLSVTEGPLVPITEVRIEGNRTTHDEVILREVGLTDHRFYSDERAREIQGRLERLQLFSSVAPPEFYVTQKGMGGLLVRVQEGQQNRFDGVVGYVPAGSRGEPAYVTGLVDLQFRNLFGTGRSLATHWARETQATQELAVRYREPWVASWPVNLEVGFGQRKQDSTYLRRSYDGSAEVMLNDMLSAGFVLSHVSVYPGDNTQSSMEASSNTTVGVTIKYDSRSDPVTPEGGVLYSTTIETGRKSVGSGIQRGSSSTRRVTFDFEAYGSFVRSQVLAFLLHGRDVESPLLDASDLFRLGGATTLRGYRESQFLGSRMAWLNAEYRFLLGGRSYAYGFFDLGYNSVPDRPEASLAKSEVTRTGYGIGARVDTRVGMIGVSLGFGEGDTFRTAKLHLRLINEF